MGLYRNEIVTYRLMQGVALGLALFLLFQPHNTLGDPGIGWHLAAGSEMWQRGAALWSDPFSVSNNAWIHDQWLSDLLFYGASSAGRGTLRALVSLLIVAAWLWLPLRAVVREADGCLLPVLSAMVLTLGMGCLQWFERPVLLSFVLFSLCVALCRRVEEHASPQAERLLLALPLLFALWANLHPGVFLGIVAVSVLLGQRMYQERSRLRAFVIAACCVATLLTPYGISLHRSALLLITNRFFLELNWEWAAPDAQQRLFLPFFASALLLGIAASRGLLKHARSGELVLTALLLLMSLLQRRYIPFFSLAAAPMLAVAIAALAPKVLGSERGVRAPGTATWRAFWSIPVVLSGACVVAFHYREPLVLSDRFPKQELAVLTAADREPGKIFHTPDWGGFLAWTSWPRWSPSIDDRNQLLGQDPYELFFTINGVRPGWSEALASGGYRYLMLEPTSPLAAALSGGTGWHELVRGARAVVFVRDNRSPLGR